MGQCMSGSDEKTKEEKQSSKNVDRGLKRSKDEDSVIAKILLLGAGGSGKSTLFKQMMLLHGDGFSQYHRKDFAKAMHLNTIVAAKNIVAATEMLEAESGGKTKLPKELFECKYLIEDINTQDVANVIVTAKIAKAIDALWKDPSIKHTWKLRSQYQIDDTADYFFTNIFRISEDGFEPTTTDILRTRLKTTGIHEKRFQVGEQIIDMIDVGGQRCERKKWIHCFGDVTSIIFVVAMSGYDSKLFEDEGVNRLHEAENLFKQVTHSEWFSKTSIILFLNKKDLFQKKIDKISLDVCWPEYDPEDFEEDSTEFEKASEYMIERFENAAERPIVTHITCATDTKIMEKVFADITEAILQQNLKSAGL